MTIFENSKFVFGGAVMVTHLFVTYTVLITYHFTLNF